MLVPSMDAMPKLDAITITEIVMMEILVMLTRAMKLQVVITPPSYVLHLMLAILSVVFLWWDAFKMQSTVMTTIIVPLILVILKKVANTKKWFVMTTMHALQIIAAPLLDAFSYLT